MSKKTDTEAIEMFEDFDAEFEIIRNLLKTKKPVPYDSIPEIFKKDFLKHVNGDTCCKNERGQFCAYAWDYAGWWFKIHNQGLDYDVQDLSVLRKRNTLKSDQ
ncbi:MAG: hypothetical protein JKY52_09525 [Flavobacteriales bacterium]|nr:hypothetical protein [Flavobacteriales bacterium]